MEDNKKKQPCEKILTDWIFSSHTANGGNEY